MAVSSSTSVKLKKNPDATAFAGGGRSVPQHVAIVMDGNGRWANSRGLPRLEGHRKGVDALRRMVRAAKELGVRYLTAFTFSTENWSRPVSEVRGLMNLVRHALKSELAELHKNGVRLHVIGRREDLPEDIADFLTYGEELTSKNDEFHLIIALSYGGRDDIVQSARRIAQLVEDGELKLEDIDESLFERHLLTSDWPDPDMIIRTSGEKRISNFLLWQSCYSELVFVDKHWPDFGKEDLADAIAEYQNRERRYGEVKV